MNTYMYIYLFIRVRVHKKILYKLKQYIYSHTIILFITINVSYKQFNAFYVEYVPNIELYGFRICSRNRFVVYH